MSTFKIFFNHRQKVVKLNQSGAFQEFIFNFDFNFFSVFKTENNKTYLVNRGWISKEEFNDQDTLIKSRITIEGIYSPFRRFGLNLYNENPITGWPKKVQELTYEQAALEIGAEVEEAVIQLSAGSVGAYEPIWLPAEFKPSRHYGYAVQWFGLALVLAVSYIYFGLKREK